MSESEVKALFQQVIERVDRGEEVAGNQSTALSGLTKSVAKLVLRDIVALMRQNAGACVGAVVINLPWLPLRYYAFDFKKEQSSEYVSIESDCAWAIEMDKLDARESDTGVVAAKDYILGSLPLPGERNHPLHFTAVELPAFGIPSRDRLSVKVAVGGEAPVPREVIEQVGEYLMALARAIRSDVGLLRRYDEYWLALAYWVCSQEHVALGRNEIVESVMLSAGGREPLRHTGRSGFSQSMQVAGLDVATRVRTLVSTILNSWSINGVHDWYSQKLMSHVDRAPVSAMPQHAAVNRFRHGCHLAVETAAACLVVRIIASPSSTSEVASQLELLGPLQDLRSALELEGEVSMVIDVEVGVVKTSADVRYELRSDAYFTRGGRIARYIRVAKS